MRKIKTVILTVILVVGMVSSTVVAQESKVSSMSSQQETLLKNAGFSAMEIESTKRQIELNNLNESQIENYIETKIESYKNIGKNENEEVIYPKNLKGESITPHGVVPTMNIENRRSNLTVQSLNDELIDEISDVEDTEDTTGVYYLVQAKSGHDQMTSYVTLPLVYDAYTNDRPYHMFGVNSTNGNEYVWGDIGLVYFPESQRWEGFYIFYERNPDFNPNIAESEDNAQEQHHENYEIAFNGSRNIYFHLTLTTTSAVMDIIESSTWSVVCTIRYDFRTNCVPANFSTTQISKQITLAQLKGAADDPLNINTGTRMVGAGYSSTHLYLSGVGDYAFEDDYCAVAKRQGPSRAAYRKVNFTNTPWTVDNVNIAFN